MWVLETKPGSPVRVSSALNCWAISFQLVNLFPLSLPLFHHAFLPKPLFFFLTESSSVTQTIIKLATHPNWPQTHNPPTLASLELE